ncbi:MAG: alkaline phosphatase [Acidobacteria bacterium]|nr:alkaline phosphatase [Acidobacteriota bacterium]
MHRREFLRQSAAAAAASLLPAPLFADPDSRQATGIKLGEVTPTSARLWMRVTQAAERNWNGEVRKGRPKPLAPGMPAASLEGAVPGAEGRIRVTYAANERLRNASKSAWREVSAATDFGGQIALEGLRPDTVYHYLAETAARGGKAHAPVRGMFRTAPEAGSTGGVSFTMTTCQKYSELDDARQGFRIYESMRGLDPRFFVSAGDIVYYDSDDPEATTEELARYHWQRMFSFPRHIGLLSSTAGYWSKDDHDTLTDDTWPGQVKKPQPLTFADGLRIFRQQVPVSPLPYRTFRWGRTLQIWMVEGRDFRSPNNAPDGPGKSIWGAEQKAWLQRTLAASDADWRVLITPTPIVGPDRANKRDNHSNAVFAHEGREIREWLKANVADNFITINGDRHWQYHSVDPETGIHELSVGPASDSHAAGTPGEDRRYHRFHRVMGGFLQVETERRGGEKAIHCRLRDVAGAVVYEFSRTGKA